MTSQSPDPDRTAQAAWFRIGKLTHSLSTAAGGLFYSVRDTSNFLEGNQVEQIIFGLRDPQLAADRAQWHVPRLRVFDGWGPRGFKVSAALVRALLAARLDVLHLHGIWNFASLAAFVWHARTGRPLVVSPHGMLDAGALAFSPTKKRVAAAVYERRNLQRASLIHALNTAEAEAVRSFGIDTPIAVIPNGVRLPSVAAMWQRDWTGNPRRTMLFLARIHPKKGVLELIAAWRAMLDAAPEIGTRWRLNLAGWDDGGLLEAGRQRVTELNLSDHVTLPGALFDEAKHAAFAEAHAFILPSLSEGLPVSILEAWAYGLPVFMTEACNLPSGFAVGAAVRIDTDAASLARTLAAHLSGDTAKLQAMGEAGRALVARDFSLEQVCADYLAMYQWLARGGEAPRFVQFAEGRPPR